VLLVLLPLVLLQEVLLVTVVTVQEALELLMA
jgi:hypothetical protein